jgi:hypothetical protein
MAETNGVKYLKINRLDANGDDCSPKIQIADNIRINYSNVGSVLYDILTIQQQADYYLIGIIPQPITSSNPGRFGFSLYASRSYNTADITNIPTWKTSISDQYFFGLGTAGTAGGDATDYWTAGNTSARSSSYEFRATPNEKTLTLHFTCSIINGNASQAQFQASAWFFNSNNQVIDLSNTFFVDTIPGSSTKTMSGSITLTGSLANLAIDGNIVRISGRNAEALGPMTASYARFEVTALPISTPTSTLLNFSPEIVNFYNTDDNVLFNNATLPKYSTIYQDIDYSTGLVPTNFELLASGNADYAPIQDSNYTATGWSNSRYKGSRASSPDFNVTT